MFVLFTIRGTLNIHQKVPAMERQGARMDYVPTEKLFFRQTQEMFGASN
jgi:hypothetical protein